VNSHLKKFRCLTLLVCLFSFFVTDNAKAKSSIPAKKLFGSQVLPAAIKPRVHGGYTRGCIAGATAVPYDGPNWQAMRLSRNRRWGHPTLVKILEDLSIKASKKGWNGLLIGDMSQPRGGPMLTGHRSHQIGLDADIWFTPMPDKRMTYQERENTSAISVLKRKSFYVDDKRWTKGHSNVLYLAAQYREVERILVHPGVKKKLCDTVKGDRSWLHKIRPFWGHHYHFHLRIGCPEGSPGCKRQNATPKSTGCDKSLAWWFKSGLIPKKKSTKVKKKKKKKKKKARKPRHIMLSDLPKACEAVLNASSPSLVKATHKIRAVNFDAPQLDIPAFSARAVMKSKPIEANKSFKKSTNNEIDITLIPVPLLRPVRR
jgi:penicillin-insensitive murein endopeptidase